MDIEASLARYRDIRPPATTVKRDLELTDRKFIAAVIGPRRSGKTTYMLMLRDEIQLPATNKILINGEDINLEGITTDQLDRLEEAAFRVYRPDEAKEIVLFVDEVQNFPSWARWLRTLFDSGRYRIVVTGSTSELSTEKLPSVLRGRALNTVVLPFSFAEFLRAKRAEYSPYMPPGRAGEIASLADEFVGLGGYPTVVLTDDKNLKLRIIQELYESVIQRDMVDRLGIRKRAVMKAFMNAALGSACRPLSVQTITRWLSSQGLELGKQTAINYLDGAEAVFFILRAYPYSTRPKERRVNPKLYAVDSGFLTLVGADESKKLENQVYVELVRRRAGISYWKSRTTGREVDFVVESGDGRELIQVASSIGDPAAYQREAAALLEAAEAIGSERLTLITRSEERRLREDGKDIEVIPAWKWFLGLGREPEGAGR